MVSVIRDSSDQVPSWEAGVEWALEKHRFIIDGSERRAESRGPTRNTDRRLAFSLSSPWGAGPVTRPLPAGVGVHLFPAPEPDDLREYNRG